MHEWADATVACSFHDEKLRLAIVFDTRGGIAQLLERLVCDESAED